MWQAQREAADRVADMWRTLLETSTSPTTSQPANIQDQLQALARGAADYWGAAFQPLRELVEHQREFVDQMLRWAELQRDLADQVANWARQQRDYADALNTIVAPFSVGGSESATSRTAS